MNESKLTEELVLYALVNDIGSPGYQFDYERIMRKYKIKKGRRRHIEGILKESVEIVVADNIKLKKLLNHAIQQLIEVTYGK